MGKCELRSFHAGFRIRLIVSLEKLIKLRKITTRHFSAFFFKLKYCLGFD